MLSVANLGKSISINTMLTTAPTIATLSATPAALGSFMQILQRKFSCKSCVNSSLSFTSSSSLSSPSSSCGSSSCTSAYSSTCSNCCPNFLSSAFPSVGVSPSSSLLGAVPLSSLSCFPRRHLFQYESRVFDYKSVVRPMRVYENFHKRKENAMLAQMEPKDKIKTVKLMKNYQKNLYEKKRFIVHVNNERERARRLGLPTPEQKLLRRRAVQKRTEKFRRKIGRERPTGFHARIVLHHLKQMQPTTRLLLRQALVGKQWTLDDPYIKTLWDRNEAYQYRRLNLEDLTIKTPQALGDALTLCISKRWVLAKHRKSPIMAERLTDLYAQQPELKQNEAKIDADDKHWWLVHRDNGKENKAKRDAAAALKAKIKAKGKLIEAEDLKRKAVNDVEREKNRILRKEHRMARGVRLNLQKARGNHYRQIHAGVPPRRPGMPRMWFEDRRKLWLKEKNKDKNEKQKLKLKAWMEKKGLAWVDKSNPATPAPTQTSQTRTAATS